MATVHLSLFEIQYGQLPPVCICCGVRASQYVKKIFTWYPRWVGVVKHLLAISICCLPALFLLMFWTTEAVEIETPLCAEHRDYWRSRRIYVYGGIALLGVLGAFVALVLLTTPKEDTLGGICCFGWLIFLWAWWLGKVIVQHSSIRASLITEDAVTLTNVSPTFADTVAINRGQTSFEEERDQDFDDGDS